MYSLRRNKLFLVTLLLLAIIVVFTLSFHSRSIDFNTQVKPIFNKKCITCHGGVRRKAKFSVLFRSEALARAESGKFAIIPGDPEHSEMIRRLTSKDPEERMPFKHDPLPAAEINILKKWIKEGAHWGDHWAYVPVQPVNLPNSGGFLSGLLPRAKPDWVKNDIDYFIYDKLEKEKLQPAQEAAKDILLRRVSLDLTGLPPSSNTATAFFNDHTADAYAHLVDTLLASPHFGEHWAAMWMDLSRYADTKGYERDASRNIWRYRDWLIRAFNADEPYNQFLTDQIAGDLLPEHSDAQLVATAFQRNTMTNDEGGTDNEEFRTAAVLDRVNTTWEAILGTTFACVQCHSHPYDPFTHEEYYSFMAFYNDTRDEDSYADYPLLRSFPDSLVPALNRVIQWITQQGGLQQAAAAQTFLKTWQPAYNSLTCDSFTNSELSDTKWTAFRDHALCRLKQVKLDQKDHLIFRYTGYEKGGTWQIHADAPAGPVLATIPLEKTKDGGWEIKETDLQPMSGTHNLYFTYTNPNLKKPADGGAMLDWLYFTNDFPGKGQTGYDSLKKTYWNLLTADLPSTPVMMDNPSDMHRVSNVFERGNWLVKGQKVEPGTPHSLNPMPAGAPRNRLGLAMWLTSKQNPLTARTIVNRMWEQLFGTGLVETLEDMGTQGVPPTHRELIDWLAWQFMNEYDWSVKKLLKEMVMSATYRQDSRVNNTLLDKDPQNKLYARAPRVRLSAEEVRDQSLAISGLLSAKMYGPSVMPWQPQGIWLSPYNGDKWASSPGGDQYRRGLYTFWKRTAPYPSMIAFDGTARTFCTPRRLRTNTPLQALTTLNDDAYVEAARYFAFRMRAEKTETVRQQINSGYETIMYKPLNKASLDALEKLYQEAWTSFKKDQLKTCSMVGDIDTHADPETAAMVVVANAMLNLDEVLTKN